MSSLKNQNPDLEKNQQSENQLSRANKTPNAWKSLNEKSQSSSFEAIKHREFPENASEVSKSDLSRRQFLGLMSSSAALMGLVSCNLIRRPKEHLLSYNEQPENVIPGRPTHYATATAIGQEVMGLLVETHEGRPTKIEGNPDHPASTGSTNHFHQAEILNLYSPHRFKKISYYNKEVDYDFLQNQINDLFKKHAQDRGKSLAFLSEYVSSPTLHHLKKDILNKLPQAKWYTYESISQDLPEVALRKITNRAVFASYQFKDATRIVSFDCDFLGQEIGSIQYTKDFVSRRDVDKGVKMNRLYMMESQYSTTGSRADHRFALTSEAIQDSLWVMADFLFNSIGLPLPKELDYTFANVIKQVNQQFSVEKKAFPWVSVICRDLIRHRGESLICVGQDQPETMHVLAYVMNAALKATGNTVTYPVHNTQTFNSTDKLYSIGELNRRITNQDLETLFILGGNPLFSAPQDINISLKNIENTFYLGMSENETSKECRWNIPQSHFLESWGDFQTRDGVVSVVQPCIMPLYKSMSIIELLDSIVKGYRRDSLVIVKSFQKKKYRGLDFEDFWKNGLKTGVLKKVNLGVVSEVMKVKTLRNFFLLHLRKVRLRRTTKKGSVSLVFKPHYSQYDGRYAENTWLQELPDPLTRLTWDNAALVSVKTAKKYGLDQNLNGVKGVKLGKNEVKMIRITIGKKTMDIPAFVLPGISDDTLILHTGYGRTVTNEVAQNCGFDVSSLRTQKSFYQMNQANMTVLSQTYPLASVQEHWNMEGRDLARVEDKNEPHNHHGAHHGSAPSLFQEHTYNEGHQWGMTIDLNKCSGCGTCVVACQAENNIPVVGKKDVILNREMHWIRMDRYFVGDENNPSVIHQGVACQHCEMAPCETVCPVAATTHSAEGLNEMTYNRCIGTRYCSNNCPYKVRRFNFFNYTNEFEVSEQMAHNPDVSLRFRGVMEKCTYCVQRINEKRIEYKNQGQEVIPDRSISTACEQSCPAEAIIFGDVNDPKSRVSQSKKSKRNYDLLAELNTRPRTSYLGRILNKNPEMKDYFKTESTAVKHH